MVKKVILAHGAHIGANAFAGTAIELLQSHPLPFGGGLYDLGIDGMFATVVRNVELDRSAGTVAIEHIVDAAFRIDDQRNFHHNQAEFLT